MTLTLYGLKTCDTCRKALKAIEVAGHDVRFIDIRDEADLAQKVPVWLAAVGADRLTNTRATTWRSLDAAARKRAETDPAALLIANPTLIKRPVIEAHGNVFVGWTRDVQSAFGLI